MILESAYRGEDGSEGAIEICKGEVDDVMQMAAIGLTYPYADPSRAMLFGGSHGGCITLRAIARQMPVQAAVAGSAPSDLADVYNFVQASVNGGLTNPLYQYVLDGLNTACGGPPSQFPDPYRERSAIYEATQIAAWPHRLLMTHGNVDEVIPAAEACQLAVQMGGFEAYHLDAQGTVLTTRPSGCSNIAINWHAGPLPTTWPGSRYLVVADNAGHGTGAGYPQLTNISAAFLVKP